MTIIKKCNRVTFAAVVCISASMLLSGCANNVSPNTYHSCEANVAQRVASGVVIGKRRVKVDGNTGTGGLAGATAGAVGGSAIGGSSRANVAAGIGGAIIGGLVGNAIEKGMNNYPAYEYIIKLKNGSTISVAQAEELEFAIREPVLVIYGPVTRIVPDDTYRSNRSGV